MPSEVVAMQEPDNPTIPGAGLLSSGRYIHFGPFRIDQQRQEVTRNGIRLKLQGKVYQTLLTLLEKPGEVVTREELRTRLWPADTHVNYDANVNTTVNKLRIALGDSSDKPLYVETIPRKGYSLLVQPEISDLVGRSHVPQNRTHREELQGSSPNVGFFRFSKSDLWVILGAIGLILTGMLLGAGIMRFWMSHPSPVSNHTLALVIVRILEYALL
ncbi:MAG TPA: winged helix-turn-helix domain-containing protein [Candidatus Acidoferrum sp.]|nr:winged helix-turn-helix domain-containing protein [Candidatus Acidoferrum sp.]